MKKNIKNLSKDELLGYFDKINEKRFRINQLYNAIYVNRITSFEAITNFSNQLKTQLDTDFYIQSLKLKDTMTSSDGSVKFLFETLDNNYIESVFLPNNNTENEHNTLCLSTMIGCPVGCNFCASGRLNYVRNLDIAEIIEQIMFIQNYFPSLKIRNAVFMGIGEPLLNYDNLVNAVKIILEFNLLNRKGITISTIGIPNSIVNLANSGLKIKVAFSLHFPNDNVRNKYIPTNFKIEEILKALDYYYQNTRLPITIEYILLEGINDSDSDIKKLVSIARRFPSVINLIPYNSSFPDLGFAGCDDAKTKYFARKLYNEDILVITRKSQGKDIFAACGMLAHKMM
ncbi:MAG: 23S rRNA (adenine(2503)-C(2))-methyltransferase RlmN [Bacteroidetes bacterium]|nr:23S rRNA (adenine(2503)-C(2))-methyltransferase RlmN [Bacteroidota bacterium]